MAEVKEAGSVVTSENSADFYAERLGLADNQEAEAVKTEPVIEESSSEPSAEEEAKVDAPKDKVEKRFSKVTKRAEQAEARASELEGRLRDLEAKASPQPIAQTAEVTDKPQAGQFNDAFEYAEALAEWSAEKALRDRDIAESQRRAEVERANISKAWIDKVEKFKSETKDFDKVVSNSTTVVSDAVRDAILESDVGPQILYFLASDNNFATKITQMPAIKALKEIGRLEAKFEEVPQVEAKTATRSKAPAPISPLKGGKAGADVLIDTNGEFYGSYAQWKAARLAKKIR